MQTVSDLYRNVIADKRHRKDVKILVDGVEHHMGNIRSLKTYGSLFKTVGIGNVIAREIDMSFIPASEIPQAAEIRPYIRVRLGDQVSEWIPKGVFYIDTRKKDDSTGVLTIHGYDAVLLYGGETYLADGDTGYWPRACDVVVDDICKRMGMELDERTVLDASITIPYPNDWTIRELLGYIGVAHVGNWTITDAGKLRLVPLWSIPDYDPDEPDTPDTSLLIDESGNYITFGGVRIIV